MAIPNAATHVNIAMGVIQGQLSFRQPVECRGRGPGGTRAAAEYVFSAKTPPACFVILSFWRTQHGYSWASAY